MADAEAERLDLAQQSLSEEETLKLSEVPSFGDTVCFTSLIRVGTDQDTVWSVSW